MSIMRFHLCSIARSPLAARGGALLSLLVFLGMTLWCQEEVGTLEGFIASVEDGQPIPGAVVLVAGTPLSTITNGKGEYSFESLEPGRYTIRVVVAGYESATLDDVEVTGGKSRRLNFYVRKTVLSLPGIVVTANRVGELPGESPASVSVVSKEEVIQRNVITIDEALPFAPGVIFNHGQMDIRGASGLARGVGSRVLMLLDGQRVLAGATGEIEFDALPVLDIDRIEIIRGAYSALYGTNALGGVVNLITRPIPENPQTLIKTHYGVYDTPSRFRFTDERLNMQGLDIQHSRRFAQLATTLFIGRKTSDGFRQNDDYSRWLVRTKLVFPAESSNPWEAFAIWARHDHGEFFTWRSTDRPFEVTPDALGDWLRSEKVTLGATVKPLITKSMLIRIQPYVYYNSTRNHFHDNQDFHRSTRLGTDILVSLRPWKKQTVTVGGEGSRTAVSSNILGEPVLHDLALYAQDELRISNKLKGSLGIRLDYHKAESSDAELNLSPKLGFVFRHSDALSYRLSVSRGYRAPSAAEQFVTTTVSGFRVVPNPKLKGETGWAAEVGVTASLAGRLWIDGALFQSDYFDLIEPAAVPGQLFTFQFQNKQRARVRGLDVGSKLGIIEHVLELQVAYTFLDSEELETGLPLPYRSVHNLSGSVSLLRGLVGVDVRYRSSLKRVLVYPLDPRDPITIVDLRLNYRIVGFEILFKVSNLFQLDYVDIQERNAGAPRSLLLTVLRRI